MSEFASGCGRFGGVIETRFLHENVPAAFLLVLLLVYGFRVGACGISGGFLLFVRGVSAVWAIGLEFGVEVWGASVMVVSSVLLVVLVNAWEDGVSSSSSRSSI
jgi:hypothetical protein